MKEDGSLIKAESAGFDLDSLIVTMEALLIEGLEPPQNRKRGDEFRAIEFMQAVDPEIERRKQANLLDDMKSKVLNDTH